MDYFDEKIKEATIKMEAAKEKGNYDLANKYAKLIEEIKAEQAYVMMELLNNNDFGFKR